DEEWRADDERRANQEIDPGRVQLEDVLQEEERLELPGVPDNALPCRRAEEREEDELVVRIVEEALGERALGGAVLALDAEEDRRFLELQPNVDREREEDRGEQERDAPAPRREGLLRELEAADEDDGEREEEAERCGGLDPARVVSAPLV